MIEETDGLCACGHEQAVHDAHGCAAFLGGYAATRTVMRYCDCVAARGDRLRLIEDVVLRADIVAQVRVRERPGAAIGVCEFPPVLELGPTAEAVLLAVKARLGHIIAPPGDGRPQVMRVVHERNSESSLELHEIR